MPRKSRQREAETSKNLIFRFKYACITCDVDPSVYGEEDAKRLKTAVMALTKDFSIDKSYVDYEGTPYEKTFMLEAGWNSLCDLVKSTDYGKKATKSDAAVMRGAYRKMILCYLYQTLEDLGWDNEAISLDMPDDTKFMVEYEPDVSEGWKWYPGKWQTWNP